MLFFFSVHLLKKIVPRLRGALRTTAEGLVKSSECLVAWYDIILSKSCTFSADVCNNAITLAKNTSPCGGLTQAIVQNPNTMRWWILAG